MELTSLVYYKSIVILIGYMKFKFEKIVNGKKKRGRKPKQPSFGSQLASSVLLFLMIGVLLNSFFGGDKKEEKISLS